MVCAKNPQQWCIAVCGGMDFYGDINIGKFMVPSAYWLRSCSVGAMRFRLTKHHFLGNIKYGLYHNHLSAIIPKPPFFETEGKLLED